MSDLTDLQTLVSHRKARAVWWSVVGVGVVVLVLWMVWLSLTLLDQSKHNGQLARDSRTIAAAILDCTSPSGECFERSEERYATAVSGINAGTLRIIAAALACEADGITERAELAACTAKRAERSANRERTP